VIELQVPPDSGNGTANAGTLVMLTGLHVLACMPFTTVELPCSNIIFAGPPTQTCCLCKALKGVSRDVCYVLKLLCWRNCVAGVSLARLLWHVPVPAMVTLIASLLLERRVLVVGQSRDMVSAAVCAAQALIHPFRWAARLLARTSRGVLKTYRAWRTSIKPQRLLEPSTACADKGMLKTVPICAAVYQVFNGQHGRGLFWVTGLLHACNSRSVLHNRVRQPDCCCAACIAGGTTSSCRCCHAPSLTT